MKKIIFGAVALASVVCLTSCGRAVKVVKAISKTVRSKKFRETSEEIGKSTIDLGMEYAKWYRRNHPSGLYRGDLGKYTGRKMTPHELDSIRLEHKGWCQKLDSIRELNNNKLNK